MSATIHRSRFLRLAARRPRPWSRRLRAVAVAVPVALCLATPVAAQQSPLRRGSRGGAGEADFFSRFNTEYDGRFTFVRLRFTPLMDRFGGGRDLKWDHDYPTAERNFMRILDEVTTLSPYMDGGNILAMDDPELFKYPVAYLCEPGFWTMSDAEEHNLRTWLLKGGFLIFDDFAGWHWSNFEIQLRRLLPGAVLMPLDITHPIFDSFFHIESLDFDHPNYDVKAQFYGVFEDNDPDRRLMVIVNYNNDIGDYWEWSDSGYIPIEISNEAYKLGVNYVVYAMTH